ncbi:hypothetical protein [Phosphitispora sp. TUW77]|uniref:hypothetical protein n=1 Tax=Phosphitispora sp. TUW77 TaxID=3152361 RepID=UPI003AB4CB84
MGRPKVYYIDTRKIFIQLAFIILLVVLGIFYLRWVKVTKVQFISPEFESSWEITESDVIKRIARGVKDASEIKGAAPEDVIIMKLFSQKETKVYSFASPEVIYDIVGGRCLKPSAELHGLLNIAARELRLRSPYGELLDWDKVQQHFLPGEKVKICDLDSKKSFMAVRKGGYSHADIQPISENDSNIIREIFGGNWSWKKRAVVVRDGEVKFAAVLTGMPHLQNGESGCFDLRLPLSCDLNKDDSMACRMMYYKASGKLDEMLQEAGPSEIILLLFTAIDQRDWQSARMMLTSLEGADRDKLENLIGVSVFNLNENKYMVYQALVSVSFRDGPYNDRRNLVVRLRQDRKTGAYLAEPDFLEALFDS